MHRIMIIDDDPEVIENVKAVLEGEELQIESYDTTTGAIERLLEVRPELLILDVMFPENPAGGFDLAREIRKTEEIKELPVILLTAINQEFPMKFASKDIDEEWMPVQDMLEKPLQLADLRERVLSLLPK